MYLFQNIIFMLKVDEIAFLEMTHVKYSFRWFHLNI